MDTSRKGQESGEGREGSVRENGGEDAREASGEGEEEGEKEQDAEVVKILNGGMLEEG